MKAYVQQVPSPYWKELHVDESKKLLKQFDIVLQESDMKTSPGSTKLLCKKMFEAHIKRWGRNDKLKNKTFYSRCLKIHLTPTQMKILIT